MTSLFFFQTEPPVAKEEVVPETGTDVIDNEMVKMVVEFIRNIKKKPEFLLEVVLPMIKESGLISDEVVKTAKLYGKSFVRSDSFMQFIDSTADYIEGLANSAFGNVLISIVRKTTILGLHN